MKRIAKFLAAAAFAGSMLAPLCADSTTTRLGLTKPDVGSTSWGPKLNTDMDQVDAACVATSTHSTIAAGVTLTNNGKSVLKGTITNDSAATGYIGEYVSASVALGSPVSGTNGQYVNITSISLTAGDWNIDGQVEFDANGATYTAGPTGAVSAFTGNTTTDHVFGDNVRGTLAPTATAGTGVSINSWRKSLSSTTTIFLKFRSDFSAGTARGYGRISALRVR